DVLRRQALVRREELEPEEIERHRALATRQLVDLADEGQGRRERVRDLLREVLHHVESGLCLLVLGRGLVARPLQGTAATPLALRDPLLEAGAVVLPVADALPAQSLST